MMDDPLRWLSLALPVFCFGYPFVMAWYWMIGAALFWLGVERHFPPVNQPPPMPHYPSISLIIPCHNEADTAWETFAALATIDYPDFEIVAVNDGSLDDTGAILERIAQRLPNMRVVHLAQNQGKASAMNIGALMARHELLVLIDGDALIERHALRWVAWYMRPSFRGGLTGNPRIRNRASLLGRLQVGEFSSIIGLIKRAQATYARLFAVSGVICAFRKRALDDGGWWSPRTLTDDVDITWRVQLAGWRIAYAPNVLVWILMPEKLLGLWRQRLRWAEGGGQMLIDNFRPMIRLRAPALLPIYIDAALSVVWAYCVLVLVLVAVLDLLGVTIFEGVVVTSLVPQWYGLTLCATYLVQALVSTSLENKFEPGMRRALFWVIWYPLAFWMLSALTAAIAMPRAALRGRKRRTTWVSPDRGIR